MRIDNNSPVPPGAGHEVHKNQNVQPQKPVDKTSAVKSEATADRVEISEQGQQLLENHRLTASSEQSDRLRKAVNSLSQALLAAGVVDDPIRAEKIAEKVVKNIDEGSGLSEERLKEIHQRLEDDFYDSPQALETIVDRLQDEMNLG